jgi:hypothetical protein
MHTTAMGRIAMATSKTAAYLSAVRDKLHFLHRKNLGWLLPGPLPHLF